ncbi:MAG TPA: betaine/proline/choline family ABC transporter ATP-binding protein [Acidothermaceae bacterium]|nr:betaine/proline/choline family ABC transporter ATP-binding protein [Acidothermaceae bacterium]
MDATEEQDARLEGGTEPMIRLDRVTKRYPDGTVAVAELSIDVPRGALVVLVGPSGCGKTTTMKMVNRLIEPTSGRIFLDGVDVTNTDPVKLRRRMGYVIQQVGLFPHRNVLDNVATVPELLGWDARRRKARARELLELVGLDPARFAKRFPHQLSGGQQQRVGVARALAADPPVLLMDEPFGAVDPIARDHLQSEFLRLQQELRKTVLFVTHDIEEAVRLGDRIAIFSQGGKLEQYDTPAALLGTPANSFVADFVGADRGLKRMSVTPILPTDLEHPPVVHLEDSLATAESLLRRQNSRWAIALDSGERLHGWLGIDSTSATGLVRDAARRMDAWVPVGASLKQAFAEMLQHNAGWVAVLDGDRFVGVLTPRTLHEALRRSVEADADGVAPEQIVLDTVSTV